MTQDEGVTEGGAAPDSMDTEKSGSMGGVGSPTMGGQGGETGDRTMSDEAPDVSGEGEQSGYSGMDAQKVAGTMGGESATDRATEQSGGAVGDPYTMGREGGDEPYSPEMSESYADTGKLQSQDEDFGDQAKKQFQELGQINLGREDGADAR